MPKRKKAREKDGEIASMREEWQKSERKCTRKEGKAHAIKEQCMTEKQCRREGESTNQERTEKHKVSKREERMHGTEVKM